MFQLEKVLGITVNSNGALASNPEGDLIAYPAGSTVVLSNVTNNEQYHIINRSKKAIKSLDFTACGKYLIFSEHGQNSAIKIWNVHGEIKLIGEIHPDDNGTRYFAISPRDNHLVTFGYNLSLNLWDWKKKNKIGGSKIGVEIKGISFSEDGKYFVTVGNKHVKYWYSEESSLNGKSAVLSDLKDLSFCDVACGKGRCRHLTYIVTKSGLLYMFNTERILQRCVKLEIGINCLVVSENLVFLGCNEATISCFDSLSLEHLLNLPKSHHLGAGIYEEVSIQDASYPDTIAITFCEANNALISIYNDHSLYIWNLRNGGRVFTKSRSFLYHSNCIWDMKMCNVENEEADRFMTCSSDNTIRSWTIGNLNPEKMICLDNNCSYLKDLPRDKNDLYYGIRCMSISSDGVDISCGDRRGNIKVYKLKSLELHMEIWEHNLEVLCLDYTPLNSNCNLLASAGKDKDICIFDVKQKYSIIQKIRDHSNSVTTVKFAISKEKLTLKLISSSNDGNCIVRSSKLKENGTIYFVVDYNISLKAVLYNIELDIDAKFIFMACQNLKIFDINTRQVAKTLRPPTKGSFVFKVALDHSNKYIATSCLDKSIVVYDFVTSNHLATIYSNLVTNLCFTQDCKRLIAVTGDGCIFIWKIIYETDQVLTTEEVLPSWVKKSPVKTADIILSTKSILPRGKWADRMENTISIKSSYISEESDASPQTPHTSLKSYFNEDFLKLDKQTVSYEAQSSTDASLEFGMQTADLQPVKPPRRKLRKPGNLKESATHSSSLESLNIHNHQENKKVTNVLTDNTSISKSKQEDIAVIKHNRITDKAITANVDSKIPVAVRKQSIESEKREKASLMIGHIKEKLEGINKKNQLKSSKSMFDLSQPPPRGSWLLTYRTSFEGRKTQMRKQGSLGDLTTSKYDSNEQINKISNDAKNTTPSRLPKPTSNSDNKQVVDVSKVREKVPAKRVPSKSNLNQSKPESRLKLSLAKPHLLSRTGTDPQIILRRHAKNEKNLANMDKQLSASNTELNLSDSFHDLNMSTVKITEKICERACSELTDAAAKAVELYRKFLDDDKNGSGNMNVVENLALSLVWAQIKLQRLNVQTK